MARQRARAGRDDHRRFVALLRGVNVGGKNTLPMRELQAALEEEFVDVTTLLQSGNVLLRSASAERDVSETVARTIEEVFGLRIPVVVRTAAEIERVAGHNPFLRDGLERDANTLHVAFLSSRPTVGTIEAIDPARSPPDACVVSGRDVYLDYPNGSGRTRLTLDYLERCLGVTGTARNWRTVQRLASLCKS
jgi:uncharacterized protein (DUF1697 family)